MHCLLYPLPPIAVTGDNLLIIIFLHTYTWPAISKQEYFQGKITQYSRTKVFSSWPNTLIKRRYYSMNKKNRRPLAAISVYGVTFLHRQNPYMVAWWSAAFPGFGHYLLNQYLRATLLTLTEIITNSISHVNEAIVYTFCGKFEMAKSVLQPQWLFGYVIVFFYAIWDSYRSAFVQNKMSYLAEQENERIPAVFLHPLEFQYIEKKNPFIAALYSFFFPGLGQFYNHQFALAFYAMFWWWVFLFLSRAHESLSKFLIGNIQESISILHPQWLLFMPSVIGGSVYYAFIIAIEHNWLFRLEQRQHLAERYRNSEIRIFP